MKSAVFLLALCCVSFALIDPPVQEVDAHNRGMAPDGIQHQNFFNYTEREPTLGDPTIFFYVEILTLTPSVNMSVTSKLHPELIWLVTERHNSTVIEGYDNGDCDRRIVRRHFDGMKPKNVVAFYTLDGLIQKVGNETVYNTANRTVVLADNETPVAGHSEVPFKPSFLCTMMAFFSKYILGDMIDLNCYEESLSRASPYATGAYNFTVRNRTIVAPHLTVALTGDFTMDYTEDGLEERMVDGECETDTWEGNGTITLSSSDFASYEVQNDYMTIIPYLPGAFSLSGNTSEDVLYHATLLSTSSLYKYYSKMDGRTAGAYYMYSFNVTEDGYGTQFILANLTNHEGLLPGDPEALDNYTGAHKLLYLLQASGLRSPTEMNNLSYNYSRVYDIEEVFYNLSSGSHHAGLEFYSWSGKSTAPSDIEVSSATTLALQASAVGDTVGVTCILMSRGRPVAGQQVELRAGGQLVTATTNAMGVCTAAFETGGGSQGATAEFKGAPGLLPSSASYALFASRPMAVAADFSIGNFGLLLLLAGLFAFSFLGLARSFNPLGGGAFMGDVFGKFFPFARRPQGKKAIRVKKGKELALSVAAAVATGGAAAGKVAGNAAAKKAAADAAKKKALEAARKARELKIRRELSEKAGKKSAKLPAGRKKRVPPKGIAIIEKMAIEATPEGAYRRDILERWKINDARAEELRKTVQEPHMRVIQEKADKAVAASDDSLVHARHELNKKLDLKPELRIVGDYDFNHFMEKAYGSSFPDDTLGVTVGNVVYLRHSGAYDEKYVQEVIKHEDYHVASKLAWNQRTRPLVEGSNEIMKYEDVMRDQTTSVDKSQVCIIEGNYRQYAAQQYLVREIVGENNFVVGHYVMDEKVLQTNFDEVAGEGQYKKIFGDDESGRAMLSNAEKINELRQIVKEKTSGNIKFVLENAERIEKEGKYDVR